MNTILIIGAVLVVFGIIGGIFPGMPGPVLSFAGILLLFLVKGPETISIWLLVLYQLRHRVHSIALLMTDLRCLANI